MGLLVKDDGWRLPDVGWAQTEPLLPERPAHPLGCHNRDARPGRDERDPVGVADGGTAEEVIAHFVAAGVDLEGLAARLLSEGADSFVKSWDELIENIAQKTRALKAA